MLALPISRRRRARKKLRALQYPANESIEFLRGLNSILEEVEKAVKQILPQLDSILSGSQAPRVDDLSDDIARLMASAKAAGARANERAKEVALRMLARVASRHALKFQEAYEQVIPVSPFLGNELWLPEQLAVATAENVRLIKSIPDTLLSQVEGIIGQGAASGKRAEELSQEIQDRLGVARSRAALIARDQVGKWTGNLNRLRQLDAGVTEYKWSTSKDERVRPKHAALEGKIIKWSDPPSVGHPGQDIRCRCVAIPQVQEGVRVQTDVDVPTTSSHYEYDEKKWTKYVAERNAAEAKEGSRVRYFLELVPVSQINVPPVWAESKLKPLLEAIRKGEKLPPIRAEMGDDGLYSIEDGIHRTNAAIASGKTFIPAIVGRLV